MEAFEANTNEKGIKFTIDLIHEVRDEANTQDIEIQKWTSFYCNRWVKEMLFLQEDLLNYYIFQVPISNKRECTMKDMFGQRR